MTEAPCFVYLMEDLCFGGVKIGVSDDPIERRKAVQIEYQTKIAVRYTVECKDRTTAFKLESRLHRRYATVRQEGEWFYMPIDLVLANYRRLKFQAIDLKTPVDYGEPPKSKPRPHYHKPQPIVPKPVDRQTIELRRELMQLKIDFIAFRVKMIARELTNVQSDLSALKRMSFNTLQ